MGSEDRKQAVTPAPAEVGDAGGQVGDMGSGGVEGQLGRVHEGEKPMASE